MRREEKDVIIDNLAGRLNDTKHFYLTDISSLNAEQTSNLRRKCFEKEIKVLVLCTPEKEDEAKKAGADYVGLDDYVEKIEKGWTDMDVIITMPPVMAKIGKLGRVLGPRGLMPNPKSGTVTMEIGKAVEEVKMGKIDFKVDKYGIVHTSIGKVSFVFPSEQVLRIFSTYSVSLLSTFWGYSILYGLVTFVIENQVVPPFSL